MGAQVGVGLGEKSFPGDTVILLSDLRPGPGQSDREAAPLLGPVVLLTVAQPVAYAVVGNLVVGGGLVLNQVWKGRDRGDAIWIGHLEC